jgi:GDPmannose 4,6-dehydratase
LRVDHHRATRNKIVRTYRPTEVDLLLENFSKLKKNLGWKPKVDFKELVLVRILVEAEDKK